MENNLAKKHYSLYFLVKLSKLKYLSIPEIFFFYLFFHSKMYTSSPPPIPLLLPLPLPPSPPSLRE